MANQRRRKISLQHDSDYAYGIISPVSTPAVLPCNSSFPISIDLSHSRDRSVGIPCPPLFVTDYTNPDELIEVGEEASIALGPHMNSNPGFRRWSLSNFQQSGNPVLPEMNESATTKTFVSDEDLSSKISRSSSSSSICKLPELISTIPQRIRKLSADNRPKFNVHNVQQNDQLRKQLQKMYVH